MPAHNQPILGQASLGVDQHRIQYHTVWTVSRCRCLGRETPNPITWVGIGGLSSAISCATWKDPYEGEEMAMASFWANFVSEPLAGAGSLEPSNRGGANRVQVPWKAMSMNASNLQHPVAFSRNGFCYTIAISLSEFDSFVCPSALRLDLIGALL
ncbi:uncharacterized protein BCR38DRAFT_96656 [Pseudomassariella vexata]|uniref:Uncharacterized protein n=1 Tax=Pseudomassariella vexata TaxID=1141098 RepID=A0A1Y2EEH5_9PEZI|nr:uncharacterized protein BCR38DRAFT_96656 [Pseudomassariella vexata]ORY69971.1 hypothetical protein BCR38DRAFT_96656 [Pseudomassariella vexata]